MGNADPKKVNATERRAQAVKLRIAGFTYKQIGEKLEMSESAVYKTIKKAMNQASERIKESSDELVTMELLRLEEIHAAIWPQVLAGDLKAIDRIHRNMDRYSRLLGLETVVRMADEQNSADDDTPKGVIVVPAVSGSVEEWMNEYVYKLD